MEMLSHIHVLKLCRRGAAKKLCSRVRKQNQTDTQDARRT